MKGLIIFGLFYLSALDFSVCLRTGQTDEIRITILYDNYISLEGLEADWGFACLIEGTERTVLFDTGTNGDILLRNAAGLKKGLESVELVVISHDHGDHAGGLTSFLAKNHDVSVYLLQAFGESLFQGVKNSGAAAIPVTDSVQICQDVYSTGEMGIPTKEQALILDSSKGIILITGCAHPGIVDVVKKAQEILKKDIFLVLGGFHLNQSSTDQIERIISDFKDLRVHKVGASHCTGDLAIELFRKEYGNDYISLGAGKVVVVEK